MLTAKQWADVFATLATMTKDIQDDIYNLMAAMPNATIEDLRYLILAYQEV